MKKLLLSLSLALLALAVHAQPPKHEVRAVWLTTIGGIDWPRAHATSSSSIREQQRELSRILDQLKKANVNTVLLQTRVRATTIYPSQYEPYDPCLTGRQGGNPGYDPLRYAIDECHKRGMELHAWVVTIPVGKWNSAGCKALRNRYPSLIHKIGDEGYMNPEMEETGNYIAKICREIVDKYDVDGIHLDYIRYPENWKIKVSKDRGRQYITDIVKKIHRAVKQRKRWVKLSCSPIGKYSDLSRYSSKGWNAYNTVCQDAQRWLREGLMDELFPMMYFRGDNFYPFAINWKEHTYGRIVAPGLGIWFLSRSEGNWPLTDITRELEFLRSNGLGHTYFRSRFFTDNTKGIYDYVRNRLDTYPALIPALTWEHSTPPQAPRRLFIDNSNDITLYWDGATDNSDGDYLTYNVYVSHNGTVDIRDSRNLVAHRVMGKSIRFRGSSSHAPLYFAVTAVDRYGNESSPLQSAAEARPSQQLLRNDGRRLYLPKKDPALDANFVVIESLAGNIVKREYYNDVIDIHNLPEGVYSIHSMNRNKKTHRLGHFIVKRGE